MLTGRRAFLAGAGATIVGPTFAGTAAAAAPRRVGSPPEARNAIEVVGTILQDGLSLTGFGWLTHVAGLADGDLFTGSQRDATTARLRWYSQVTVKAADVLPSLFSVTGTGALRIFFDGNGGAQPDVPATFPTGRLVARYSGRFHNVLSVIAPDQAVTEITGELLQRETRTFELGGRRCQLGRDRLLQRLSAKGPGTRTEPTTPRATFRVAGGFVVPD
jgi:hypothetical protein